MKGRPYAPQGEDWDEAVEAWRKLPTDEGATFDTYVVLDGADIEPHVTWGTTPAQSVPDQRPRPAPRGRRRRAAARETAERSLTYMDLKAGTPIQDDRHRPRLPRLVHQRAHRGPARGRQDRRRASKIATTVRAMVVPGSGLVKAQAEQEGLDQIFKDAGFEWRDAGCSMCLGMNPDILLPGERCASTSNRNFEGRQGAGGRTHLVSPEMAAAAAIAGHFVDIREVL